MPADRSNVITLEGILQKVMNAILTREQYVSSSWPRVRLPNFAPSWRLPVKWATSKRINLLKWISYTHSLSPIAYGTNNDAIVETPDATKT
jgi:hypothetical protein